MRGGGIRHARAALRSRVVGFQAGLRARERELGLPGPAPSREPPADGCHSGVVQALDSPTVAGAAPALATKAGRTGFPFHPGPRMHPGHLELRVRALY